MSRISNTGLPYLGSGISPSQLKFCSWNPDLLSSQAGIAGFSYALQSRGINPFDIRPLGICSGIHMFLGLLDPDPDPILIRIRLWIRILLSLSQNSKKKLYIYYFVTSF
jgi:hypothetical protein